MDLSKFNDNVEYLIVVLCIAILEELPNTEVHDKLLELLNLYEKYLCKAKEDL